MFCSKHPKYKAIHQPRVKCRACWRYYRFVQAIDLAVSLALVALFTPVFLTKKRRLK